MATAYNPATKTLFVPLNNLCMDYKAVEQQPLPGEDYGRGRMVFRHAPGNNGDIGRVEAVNLEKKETQWTQQRRPYWSSSLLATAGGVVFGGDTNRRIVAFDVANGKIVWELPLNSQPGGFPMTYMAGGKQYVAIPTGLSLIGNRVLRSLTPEIPVPSRGSTLMVFALSDADFSVTGVGFAYTSQPLRKFLRILATGPLPSRTRIDEAAKYAEGCGRRQQSSPFCFTTIRKRAYAQLSPTRFKDFWRK